MLYLFGTGAYTTANSTKQNGVTYNQIWLKRHQNLKMELYSNWNLWTGLETEVPCQNQWYLEWSEDE